MSSTITSSVSWMSDLASSGYGVRQSKSANASDPNTRLKASAISNSSHTTYSKELTSSHKRPFRNSDPQGFSWISINDSTATVILDIPENGVSDWTLPEPKGALSARMKFARSIDWASTPLGPMTSWSAEFRQMTNLLLTHPHPAALFWGNEMTVIYNEAYRDVVAGRKHPDLMGTGFKGPFSEIWDDVGQIFAECGRTGHAVAMENQMLPIERHGFMEETYFTWSATPIYGGTPKILGFYNAPFETTREIIGDRRMRTLQRLGEKVAMAKTAKEFWVRVLKGLEENHYDVPFALLYSVVDIDDGDSSSHSSSGSSMSMKSCVFEGGLGIPKGHPAAPPQLDLKSSREGFIPSFREAMRTREPTKLQTRDSTLPESLLEGIEWRGFGEPCREAIICPVRPTTGENVLGFLLLGVNPRRPYDGEYRSFMDMLNRQLAASLASTMLYEEETRRGRTAAEAAALEHEHLNEQLAVQTSRLQRMTELSPVGLFYISPQGVVLEANDRQFEMIGHPKDNKEQYSWLEFVREDYQPILKTVWENMIMKGVPWSGEVQLKKKWVDQVTRETDDYWILGSVHPEYASDGSMRSVMGSITDINHIKWA
jgi:PAS domain S-box-containing protein